MTKNEEMKEMALVYACHYIGDWYRWGGEGPDNFDCSGFVGEFLQAAGAIQRYERLSAQGIWDRFKDKIVQEPDRGCLILYHSNDDTEKMVHTEICLNKYQSLGASGGGSKTLTLEDAIRDNAFIKMRPIGSRGNIKGYVDPFLEE